MIDTFPSQWLAPSKLLSLDANCGLITAWGVLKYFKKRTSAARLITACRYTKQHGIFAIALAVALREHGLSVAFHSEDDPEPKPIETECYALADQLGVDLRPALDLDELLALVSPHQVPIILYDTDDGDGHFSPIVGTEGDDVLLPYGIEPRMPKDELTRRWTAPEIYRQCVVVSDR